MLRFQDKQQHTQLKTVLMACLFILIAAIIYYGIDTMADGSADKQKSSLEASLNHSIRYCYAVEGSYPESLDYIVENYGLVYDKDRFFVDYKPMGANILPDVTIIEKGE